MKQTIILLNHLYKSCELTLEKINSILTDLEDTPFQIEMKKQKEKHEKIKYLSDGLLASLKEEEEQVPMIEKVNSYLSTKLSTLTNNDPDHVAHLMITHYEGMLKETKEKVHACKDAKKEALDLSHQLEELLEEQIHALENWIS